MNVLVLGGTGAMGRPMVEVLASNCENEVYYVSRNKSHFDSNNIHHIQGNFFDDACFEYVFGDDSKWDYVVDFLIYSPADRERRIHKILEKTGQYVCTSSASVYKGGGTVNVEDTPRWIDGYSVEEKQQYGRYHIAKAVDEDVIRACKHRNWTIVRPSNTWSETKFGLYTWPLSVFAWRYINEKEICVPEEVLDHQFTVSYGADVAKAISLLLGREEAYGEIFNICASDNIVSYREMIELYNKIFHELDMSCLRIKYVKAKEIYEYIPWEKDLWFKDRAFESRVCSAAKFEELTGRVMNWLTVEDLLRRCVNSFFEEKNNISPDPVRNALMDRITNDKTSLKVFNNRKDKVLYFIHRYKILNYVYLTYQRLRGISVF